MISPNCIQHALSVAAMIFIVRFYKGITIEVTLRTFFFISTKLCSNSTIQQFKNCVLITKYQHKQFYGVFSPKKNKGDENTVCDKIKIETKD